MRAKWLLFAYAAVIALDHVAIQLVSARTCVLGTEPDEAAGGRVRFVLPPGNPCSCTKVKLGGHNPYAPPRKDQPIYIDTLPTDTEGLRQLFDCPELIPSTLDVTSAVIPTTSDVTSTVVPTTTEIPAYPDCQAARDAGHTTSGVYTIYHGEESMEAYCDMETLGQGYIVIQRRMNGSVSFERSWEDYGRGFGNLEGEFWWGNEKLRSLTETGSSTWELVVDLEAFDGDVARVHYETFSISGSTFDVDVGTFANIHGMAGDAIITHQNAFSAYDQDNDDSGPVDCAEKFKGGWWYNKCNIIESNLNGVYSNNKDVEDYQGIQWNTWKGTKVSLKQCEMKIRRNP